MSRLPTVGGDNNTWGNILNDFLAVEHNSNGTQKTLGVNKGGTGATDAASARSNLGAVSSSDSRLTDNRTPTNGSVTDAKVASNAAIAISKLAPGNNGQVLTTTGGAAAWGDNSGSDSDAVHKGDLVLNIKDYGAVGDGTTDDTAAIQAALDAAAAVLTGNGGGATVFIPSSTDPFMFTNLTMHAYTTLRGQSMSFSHLNRLPGATGTALREKTAAEGNAPGASGIWIRDLVIEGGGTTGDGIDLGNQGGPQLNYLAGLENVMTRDFKGTGMILNCNAVANKYLWSNLNTVGFELSGGASTYLATWAEANTDTDMLIHSIGDTFHHIQIETSNAAEQPIKLTGFQNAIFGAYIGLFADNTNDGLITFETGSTRHSLYHIWFANNGKSFNNGIFINAWDFGTGNAEFLIPIFIDDDGRLSHFYNQFSNVGITVGNGSIDSAPAGQASIGANGAFALVNASTLRTSHIGGATPNGGDSGDIKIGTGKIWVNDGGTWKSTPIS